MFEGIIVPLDGSELAEVALPYAEEMAGKIGSELILLSVINPQNGHDSQNQQKYLNKMQRLTKIQIEKYIGINGNKDINVAIESLTGNPAEAILEYSSKNGYYKLIVMATHGLSGISRWALGSVADKVVRADAKRLVLLIRAKGSHPDIREKRIFKKALIPLDGSKGSRSVIPYIGVLGSKLKMELTLLQVVQRTSQIADADAQLKTTCDKLNAVGINSGYQVNVGNVAENIIDLADEQAFDLVAMSTRGTSGVELWTMGSVAQKVLLGGNTPLLLIKQ